MYQSLSTFLITNLVILATLSLNLLFTSKQTMQIHHENMSKNFDPLKPHFYIVKLSFTGCILFALFLLKNKDCGYSLEPPRYGYSL